MRKSTTVIASVVAISALVISLRIGEISTQQSLMTPLVPSDEGTATPDQSTEPDQTNQAPTTNEQPTAKPQPPATTETVESDPITYKYGVVQLSVTKLGGQITAVDLIQGDATNGRDKAYKILEDATIQVQGTNYGNFSGATFTTDAYKLAVENALSKF